MCNVEQDHKAILQANGKLKRQAVTGASVLSAFHEAPTYKQFCYIDNFLVDTGSKVTLVPRNFQKKTNLRSNTVHSLIAANGSKIKVHGLCTIHPIVDGVRYQHQAIVADVICPILGMDFLKGKDLVLDLDEDKLRLRKGNSVNTVMMHESNENNCIDYQLCSSRIREMLKEYPSLTKTSLGDSAALLLPLAINTSSSLPVFSKVRPLHGAKREEIEAEILKWEREGIIERVTEPVEWASPIHAVKKSNGSWRVCGDFRLLNNVTIMDRYPLPTLVSFNSRMAGAKIFSKIDLKRAYHQVKVKVEDQSKTVINTTLGLFKFLRMPFGLKNAGQQFMRNIHLILNDFDFLFAYMDDLIVFSKNVKDHVHHVKQVLERLKKFGILINEEKCAFGCRTINFLGHTVTPEGINVPKSRVETIANFPKPESKKGLERFLGLFAFVHRFIPRASEIVRPLNTLRGFKTNKSFCSAWEKQHEDAFEKAKDAITKTTLLVHPRSDVKTELWTDASDFAIGAVLVQDHGLKRSQWTPVAYWSKSFNPGQRSYSPFDKELLAVSYSVSHFREYLEGQEVIVRTDHKPLVGSLSKTTNNYSALQRRHFNRIAQYVDKICHLSGKDNSVADALSRLNFKAENTEVPDDISEYDPDKEVDDTAIVRDSFSEVSEVTSLVSQVGYDMPNPQEFRRAQDEDSDLQAWIMRQTSSQGSPYKPGLVPCADVSQQLWANKTTSPPQILVPVVFQKSVFSHIHGLSHPGFKTTLRLISHYYFWPEMRRDVRKWTQSCINCQRNKVHLHTKSPLQDLPQPTRRFANIHIDIVGPLNPVCEGKNTLFTIIDQWTGWPEAVPMSCRGEAASASACAKILVTHWVAKFGIPEVITSDRGPQFVSKLWQELSKLIGFHHVTTSAYHPQHNGKIERMHRSLKNAIRARLDGQKNWLSQLPWALLGLRSAPNVDTGISPAVLVYGQQPVLPGMMVLPRDEISDLSAFGETLAQAMSKQSFSGPSWHGGKTRKSYVPKDLQSCDYVLLRVDSVQPSLNQKYSGPYRVVKRGEKVFVLQLPDRLDSVTIDRLIPFYES